MAPRTRKPTGAVPWPLVLVEGEEKAGKSWAIAQLSASPKVGTTYWVDLAEGSADEYGAIPGARYEIVDHDGTWRDIIAQVREVRATAQVEHDAGRPPVVLGIDSMTAEWVMLAEWVEQRARRSDRGKALLAKNPDGEVPISANYWNDANVRHRKLMTLLMTFPGIVVVTARGKWVAEMDKKGNPVPNSKVYKVEGQKNLAYDASVWVRFTREQPPLIVGARSVHAGVKPGTDDPRKVPGLTLEWLIFEALKCDPHAAHVRDMRALDATALDEQEAAAASEATVPQEPAATDWDAALAAAAGDLDALRALWAQAGAEDPNNTALAQRIRAAVVDAKAASETKPAEGQEQPAADGTQAEPAATDDQLTAIAAAIGEHNVKERDHRLAVISLLVGDRITTSSQLTRSEASHVIDAINKLAESGQIADTITHAIAAYAKQEAA